MSNWVRFSDRMPTEADAGPEGEVFVQHSGGMMGTADIYWASDHDHHDTGFWLENVPPLPTPRTIKDVVLEYIDAANWIEPWECRYRDEMKEILEREEHECSRENHK